MAQYTFQGRWIAAFVQYGMHYHISVGDLVEDRVRKAGHRKRTMKVAESFAMNAPALCQRADFSLEMFQKVGAHTARQSLVEFSAVRQVPHSGDAEAHIHFV